jgi:NAD(P)-dependent dehydrogenase (short-subunit alcohol dehydrogenase family)
MYIIEKQQVLNRQVIVLRGEAIMRILKDKVVVIPGASGGMGREISKLLAGEGAKLALASNDEKALEELEGVLNMQGVDVISKVIDVTSETEVEEFFRLVKSTYGKADILLNLPGISVPAQISEMGEDIYDLTMDVNLKGAFLCAKHFIPIVDTEIGGQIINIGSMAAKRANANAPMYCTAKAAVNMFSQGLALQLIDKKIRVTTLNPGPTDTGFWGNRPVPRDKFMQAMDVADIILFILKANPAVVFHEVNFESFAFFK